MSFSDSHIEKNVITLIDVETHVSPELNDSIPSYRFPWTVFLHEEVFSTKKSLFLFSASKTLLYEKPKNGNNTSS